MYFHCEKLMHSLIRVHDYPPCRVNRNRLGTIPHSVKTLYDPGTLFLCMGIWYVLLVGVMVGVVLVMAVREIQEVVLGVCSNR